DQLDQLIGRSYGPLPAGGDDKAGDAIGPPLLPVLLDNAGKAPLVQLGEKVGGAFGGVGIHAHVEGDGPPVRKSPFRTVELVRREAQVKEGPIDPLDAHPIEDPGEVAKVAPGDDHSIAKSFEPRLCSCERLRITVDPQESSMG